MFKTVIKETTIMILLFIAIALLFILVFYDYNPTVKPIPIKKTYETPKDIKEQLAQIEEEKTLEDINITYYIEPQDLEIYRRSNSYNPGKINPFAKYSAPTSEEAENENNTTNTTTNNANSNSTGKLSNNTSSK